MMNEILFEKKDEHKDYIDDHVVWSAADYTSL